MVALPVAPGVWRLPFPSRTLPPFDHTNGWLIASEGRAALVDPGFRDGTGVAMVEGALAGAGAHTLEAVWLTHTHQDHCEGLAAVRDVWPEARVSVHPLEADRVGFTHHVATLDDGSEVRIGGRRVRVLHTPGHSPGHLAFHLLDIGWIFVGDVLAGRGSVWIGTPEGDVAAYLASLDRLAAERPRALAPGHGDVLADPIGALQGARDHRLQREGQIVEALRASAAGLDVPSLRERVYPGLDREMAPLAERSLLAHLHKLRAEERVVAVDLDHDPRGRFRLAP